MVTRAEVEAAKQEVQRAQAELAPPRKRVAFTPRQTRATTQRFQRELRQAGQQIQEQETLFEESQKQKQGISDRIEQLKKDIKRLEVEETRGSMAAALGAASQKYGKQAELAKLKEIKGTLGEDQYIPDFEDFLKSMRDYGKQVQQREMMGFVPAIQSSRLPDPKTEFEKSVRQWEIENPTEKLMVDWKGLKVTGVQSGALGQSLSIENYNRRIGEVSGDYQIYDKPLKAYYDPVTGQEVLQSIAPSIAQRQGLLPIEIKGYSPSKQSYLIESQSGLLTPSQEAYRQLYSKVQKVPLRDVPSTFEIGGVGRDVDPLQIIQPTRTPYEAALRKQPYARTEQEIIDYQRLGAKGFREKYGYEITPTGERLDPGTAVPITPEDVIGVFPVARAAQIGRFGIAAGIAFSEPITRFTSETIDRLIPRQDTGFALTGAPPQIGRGALFYAMGSNPVVAPAYVKTILKSAATDPAGTVKELAEYAKGNPYELATIGLLGKAEIRVRQRIARSKMYYEVVDRLEVQYGTGAKEVLDFQKAWKRAFKELPKRSDVVRKWSSKDLEAAAGDKKLVKILDDINSKYGAEVIGTTTIMPQTTLKELPRGKAGDIDVQNVPAFLRSKSKQMAYETFARLQQEGYNVRIREGSFFGNPKYYITIFDDAKGRYIELINIGTDTGYFLNTQLAPLRDLFEFKRIGQFVTDPVTGVRMSGIRGQLRVKLAKGYGEGSTARIRQLEKLMKEGKLVGREKDIIDALGILEGTEYLFKDGKYIGTRSPLKFKDVAFTLEMGTGDLVRGSVAKVNELLTGKGISTPEYSAYYDLIPTKRRKAYAEPRKYYKKEVYNPSNYLIPKQYTTPYKPRKPSKYKPPYNPRRYLVPTPPTYKPPKKTPYKPPYTPSIYLIPGAPPYAPPKTPYKPPYVPPTKKAPPIENFLIPPRKTTKKKKVSKKKKKKPVYKTLPTLTQQLTGVRRIKPKEYITGFELVRI